LEEEKRTTAYGLPPHQRKGLFCATLRIDDLTNLGWEWNWGGKSFFPAQLRLFWRKRLLESEMWKGKGKDATLIYIVVQ